MSIHAVKRNQTTLAWDNRSEIPSSSYSHIQLNALALLQPPTGSPSQVRRVRIIRLPGRVQRADHTSLHDRNDLRARLRPARPGERARLRRGRGAGRHAAGRRARDRDGGLGLDGRDPGLRAPRRRVPGAGAEAV